MTKHVFLIGFMGCGKTYWGSWLAERVSCPFIDLDRRIELHEQKTISDIFREAGESGFRELERRYLHKLKDIAPAVIATGGGAPCFFDNLSRMRSIGIIIYLRTPVEVLFERLKTGKAERPLLKDLNDYVLSGFIRERLETREPFYLQADYILEYAEDHDLFAEKLLDVIRNGH